MLCHSDLLRVTVPKSKMNISAEQMTFKVHLKSTHRTSLKTAVNPVRAIHQKQEQSFPPSVSTVSIS